MTTKLFSNSIKTPDRLVIVFLLISCFYGVDLFAIDSSPDKVKIYGNAPEYANNKIVFFYYMDRITYLKDTAFILEIDDSGYFETETQVNSTRYVFSEIEIYHAFFYIEPNKTYELVLPPLEKKTEADIFNPFFEPVRIHVGMKNLSKTDLNFLINEFDYFYNRYFDLHFLDIIAKGMESSVDTFIVNNRKHFSYASNEYFKTYQKYRYAYLRHLATEKKFPHVVVYANYTKDTVWYDNPAYMDLFNIIYDKYFDNYLGTKGGKYLYNFINFGHSISNLRDLFSKHLELSNMQFREMVILKGISDSFLEHNFGWLPLLLTLDSLHISTNYDIHRDIAQNIADNTLSMAKGTVAPPFELEDKNGDLVNLASYRGHYVYLVFANTTTYTSQAELDLLKRVYDRYNDICKIVTILTDDDKEKAIDFIHQKKYEWDFLFTEINSPILSTYKVESYPTYYFINFDGSLIMSPAPSPAENFEKYLFQIVQYRGKLK